MAKTKEHAAPLQNLSGSNYVILMSIVSLLILGGTVLAGKELVSTWMRDYQVSSKKRVAIGVLDKNLETAPQLISNHASLGATAGLINASLPNDEAVPALIAQLENMSTQAGVDLKSFSPSVLSTVDPSLPVSDDANKPQQYNFSLSLGTNYENLRKFVSNVELSARPMRVNSMQVSGTANDLTVTLGVTTYYQGQTEIPYKLEKLAE